MKFTKNNSPSLQPFGTEQACEALGKVVDSFENIIGLMDVRDDLVKAKLDPDVSEADIREMKAAESAMLEKAVRPDVTLADVTTVVQQEAIKAGIPFNKEDVDRYCSKADGLYSKLAPVVESSQTIGELVQKGAQAAALHLLSTTELAKAIQVKDALESVKDKIQAKPFYHKRYA